MLGYCSLQHQSTPNEDTSLIRTPFYWPQCVVYIPPLPISTPLYTLRLMDSIRVLKDLLTQQKATPLFHSQVCCGGHFHEVLLLFNKLSGSVHHHHSPHRDGDVCGKEFAAPFVYTLSLFLFSSPPPPSLCMIRNSLTLCAFYSTT